MRSLARLFLIVTLVSACHHIDQTGPIEPSLQISPHVDTLEAGDSVQMLAEYHVGATSLPTPGLVWSVSPPTAVHINVYGLAVSDGPTGPVTVTATYKGLVATATIVVRRSIPLTTPALVYERDVVNPDNFTYTQLRRVNLDGSGDTRVTPTNQMVVSWSLSPDGWEVAAMYALSYYYNTSTYYGKTGGYVVDVLTGAERFVAPLMYEPVWSSDGQWLAYQNNLAGAGPHVLVVRPNGFGTRQVTIQAGEQLLPRWSLDGQHLGYIQRDSASADGSLWIIGVNGLGAHAVPLPVINITDFAWSPDGAHFLIKTPTTLWTADTNGAHPHQVIVPCSDGGSCDTSVLYAGYWSPDGQHIAFRTQFGIYVANADGSGVTLVTAAGMGSSLAWSRDGTLLLFGAQQPPSVLFPCISSIRPDGTGLTQCDRSENAANPQWSGW